MAGIKACMELSIYDVQSSDREWEGRKYKVYKAATNIGLVDMNQEAYEAFLQGYDTGYTINYNPNNAKIKIVFPGTEN